MTKPKANMCFSKASLAFFYLAFSLYFSSTHTATFFVVNQCNYTVWASLSTFGGGPGNQRLNSGRPWTFNVDPDRHYSSLWGRTNCSFDHNGGGNCLSGDCGFFECNGSGDPPRTVAWFGLNMTNNSDVFYISLEDGFNIPMDFSPTTNVCRGIQCVGPINEQCPHELRAPGGCQNPCEVFKTEEYCCTNGTGSCGVNNYSMFFRENCPDAITFKRDDFIGAFTCPSGTDYRIVFCPLNSPQDDDHTPVFFNTCPDGTDYWVLICPS